MMNITCKGQCYDGGVPLAAQTGDKPVICDLTIIVYWNRGSPCRCLWS